MKRNTAQVTVVALIAAIVSGCASPPLMKTVAGDAANTAAAARIMEGRLLTQAVDPTTVRGSAAHAERLAADQRQRPVLRMARSPWIGGRMVPATNDDKLPNVFREHYDLNFSEGASKVGIEQVAARLTKLTSVPVRVQPDVFKIPGDNAPMLLPPGSSISRNAPLPSPLPGQALLVPGGDSTLGGTSTRQQAEPAGVSNAQTISVDAVDTRWKGSLQGFLNHVTDRLGLAWEYRDNTIVIMRYVTAYHEISTFPGMTDFEMSSGGSATGGSSGGGTQQNSTANLAVKESGKLDAAATIERAVTQMVKAVPGSEVIRSDGSGRLIVKTTKEMQAQVRDFIRAENSAMLRQVQVQFDIYSVRSSDVDEAGINWNIVFQSLTNGVNATLNGPALLTGTLSGNVGVNILNAAAAGANASDTNRRFGDSSAVLNLLRQGGMSAQHRPVSLLALNRQWARKAKLNTEGYLSETTPGTATANGVGIPGLKTDRITTGDSYVAMPHILDNNTVLLKFGVNLSDLLGLFDVTSGTGAAMQKVQVPRVSAVSDQYTVALRTGEVMAITGLSRLVSTSDSRTLTENAPMALGGSRRAEIAREHFLILVRPVLL